MRSDPARRRPPNNATTCSSAHPHIIQPRPFEYLHLAPAGSFERDRQVPGDVAGHDAKRPRYPAPATGSASFGIACTESSAGDAFAPAIGAGLDLNSPLPRAARGSLRRRQGRLMRATVLCQTHVGAIVAEAEFRYTHDPRVLRVKLESRRPRQRQRRLEVPAAVCRHLGNIDTTSP